MDENNRASDTSCHRAGIASQLSPLTRSSLSECSSLTQAIHAAFCAGIRYVAGNCELKPWQLEAAKRYTEEQIILERTPPFPAQPKDKGDKA